METLRIAHIMGEFEPSRGGQSRMVASVARALAARGHALEVFAFGATAAGDGFSTQRVSRRDLLSGRFFRRLRDGRFDVLHAHGYSSLAPAKALPAELAGRSARVLTPHFHETGGYPLAVRRAYDMSLGAAVCRAAQQIQVDTEFERDALARLQAIPMERFEVIPPSLAETFAGSTPRARRRHPEAGFRVLFVGRLEPYKGLDHLIAALGLLKKRTGGALALTVVGDGTEKAVDGFRELAMSSGLGPVEFCRRVTDEELRSLYDSSGALALPSRSEAFGIVLLEAMSRGLPVIAARAGGMPALVKDGQNGLLVPYGDPDALAGAIARLVADAGLWGRLSEAGMETARAYSPDAIGARTEAAYRRVVRAN